MTRVLLVFVGLACTGVSLWAGFSGSVVVQVVNAFWAGWCLREACVTRRGR